MGKIAILLVGLAWPAWGQTAYGLITGSVRDATTLQPISGAAVSYTNVSTQASQTVRPAKGVFTFAALSPGIYRISAAADGYQDRTIQQLELPVAGHFDLRFDLWKLSDPWHAGAMHSVVMPGSHAVSSYYGPDLNTSRSDTFEPVDVNTSLLEAAVSTVIGPRDLDGLPLTGRDVYALLVLLPGVTADTATARGLGFSVNGQRPSSSNYLLDGLENNDLLVTGPLGAIAPEAVSEYRVSTSDYAAEYGRTSGFVANAVSRSGGSEWHGTGYLHLKNELLNANGFQENAHGIARAPMKEIQPGVTVQGPLRRRVLFISGSLELVRFRSRNDPQTYALPPAGTGGLLLRMYPPPGAGLMTLAPPVESDGARGLARLDYVLGTHRLFARAVVSRQRQPFLLYNPYPGFSSPFHQGAVSVGAGWTWQKSPAITHELRVGRTGSLASYDRPHAEVPRLRVDEELTAPDGTTDPVWLPGSQSTFGYRDRSRNWEAADNWTWVRGGHIWKAGGGLMYRHDEPAFTADRAGDYRYHSLAGFAADAPYQLIEAHDSTVKALAPVPNGREYREWQANWFAQDSWRASERLTFHYGLRYDWFGGPVNTGSVKDRLIGLGPGPTLAEQLSGAHYLALPGGDKRLFDTGRGDWGVRAGVSYSRGNTVLRASYGIFYDRPFDNLWQIVSINRQVADTWTFSQPVNVLSPPLEAAQTGALQTSTQYHAPLLFQPGIRDPRVQSAFAGMEHRLADGLMLDVKAMLSHGARLWTTDIVNRAFSGPDLSRNQGRYSTDFEDINYRQDAGVSDYAALAAVLRVRRGGMTGQVSYTWGHAIDNQSDALAGAFVDYNQAGLATKQALPYLAAFTTQFASAADRANADFDQRHNLVFFGTYEIPAVRQQGMAAALLRGWRISGVGAVRSGLPFSVFTLDNTQDPGGFLQNQRADLVAPDLVFRPAAGNVAGGKQLLNQDAFQVRTADSVGTSGRNAFAGPGLVSADVSIARSFAAGERVRITLRADMYNALNHANLNNPNNVLIDGAAGFGQALYGRRELNSGFPVATPFNETARQVQVFLRVEF
jgi:hypothetical protein